VITMTGCRVRNVGREKLHDRSTSLGSCGEVAHGFELSAQVTFVHDSAKADAARRANLLKAMANRWPSYRFRQRLEHIVRTPQLSSHRDSTLLCLPGTSPLPDSC
jgi:hypothetical protein